MSDNEKQSETKRINIRMPVQLNDWVNEQAHIHGVNVTAFINMRLAEIKRQDDMTKAMALMTNEKLLKMLENKE